ncbi:MAG: hypothetical protein SFU27_02555, partial [Thermonemataceae bacterium]|nr:hypothetical protein [Thermonemataceae bacterium]
VCLFVCVIFHLKLITQMKKISILLVCISVLTLNYESWGQAKPKVTVTYSGAKFGKSREPGCPGFAFGCLLKGSFSASISNKEIPQPTQGNKFPEFSAELSNNNTILRITILNFGEDFNGKSDYLNVEDDTIMPNKLADLLGLSGKKILILKGDYRTQLPIYNTGKTTIDLSIKILAR